MKRSPAFSKLAALTLLAALPFAASAADGNVLQLRAGQLRPHQHRCRRCRRLGPERLGRGAPNVHLFGSYANQKIDGTSADFDQWRVGVGYNKAFSPKADFVANVAYD